MCASHGQSLRRIFKAGSFFRSVQYPAYETFSNYRKLKLMLSLPLPPFHPTSILVTSMEKRKKNTTLLLLFDYFTEYTQRQWPLSGVHPIMRVKSSQTGEGGGVGGRTFFPFTISVPSRAKLWCTLQLRWEIHYPYFSSTPTVYVLCELVRPSPPLLY
jgi:hypothetical protein